MSQDFGNSPPAPPRKGRSPWVYVGAGCGILTLVGGVGCAAVFFTVAQEMNRPVDKAEVIAALGDVPIYPGAKLDETATKSGTGILRIIERFSPGKYRAAGFRADDAPEKVFTWYSQRLNAQGYTEQNRASTMVGSGKATLQARYQKQSDTIVVQVQPAPGDDNPKGSFFVLSRIRGLADPASR